MNRLELNIKNIIIVLAVLLIVQHLNSQELIRFGNHINTAEDEFLPVVHSGKLYFGRTYVIGSNPIQKYKVLSVEIDEVEKFVSRTTDNSSLKFDDLNNFASASTQKRELFRYCLNVSNTIKTVRTNFYHTNNSKHDFHPAFSPDDSYMVFVSDRKGGIGRSDTTTDLYISFKSSEGTWSEGYNLGSVINSPQNEITPFIDDEMNLYYSSKRKRKGKWVYDIMFAKSAGYGKWNKPLVLNNPINSAHNETGAFVSGDSLIFASDRPSSRSKRLRQNYDLYCVIIDRHPKIDVKLDTKTSNTLDIDFNKYNMTFFVPGYYKLNTIHNLSELLDKFNSGQYGYDIQTEHIVNPANERFNYQRSSEMVETAIKNAIERIIKNLENYRDEKKSPFQLIFTGYSDRRSIGSHAVYDGKTIRELNPFFIAESGVKLDDKLLSKLRAYYTAEYFKSELEKYPIFHEYEKYITWIVKGKTRTQRNTDNRTVVVTMKLLENQGQRKIIPLIE